MRLVVYWSLRTSIKMLVSAPYASNECCYHAYIAKKQYYLTMIIVPVLVIGRSYFLAGAWA